MVPLKYISGEEIRAGDRITYAGEPGIVEFVVTEKSGDPTPVWFSQRHSRILHFNHRQISRRVIAMLKIIRRIGKFALFCITVIFLGTIGCRWFPESTFELAGESRLPKWISLPPGLTRSDVSLTMNYYVKPWGSSATFILQDAKGKVLTKVSGKVRDSEPKQLKESRPGFPTGYPSYAVITVNGITEIIEHRKMEPIFYVTDDPVVRQELGVRAGL